MSHLCKCIVVDGIQGDECGCSCLVWVSYGCLLEGKCLFWGHLSMLWRF